jgi:hypothetical protein
MALLGSASANLSPILFKGNNRALAVNVLIHQDQSGSMNDLIQFYSTGTFIGNLQDALLEEKIGIDTTSYPNLYGYFDLKSRNPSSSFTISNSKGSLSVNNSFIYGRSTGSATGIAWTSSYINSIGFTVNICTNVKGSTTGGRLVAQIDQNSEDVHGNLWSIYTTPNAISSQTPGNFGSVIGSNVRKGSTTIIITNSDEQTTAPAGMIGTSVYVHPSLPIQRTINGPTGELVFREYRVIALSSYSSTDGYVGVLFYGSSSSQPYGYITFNSPTAYTITRSTTPPSSWVRSSAIAGTQQLHDTLSLASETRGALFKLRNVFGTTTDYRVAFSKCIAEFIAATV